MLAANQMNFLRLNNSITRLKYEESSLVGGSALVVEAATDAMSFKSQGDPNVPEGTPSCSKRRHCSISCEEQRSTNQILTFTDRYDGVLLLTLGDMI